MKFSAVLKGLRKEQNLTQAELANKLGLTRSSLSMYELGEREPDFETLEVIADFFNVDMNYLMGKSDRTTRIISAQSAASSDIDALVDTYSEVKKVQRKSFPLLGEVACGTPIFANEEHDSYIEADADIDADFCLRAKGDSMIGVGIHDGDIVYIKRCSSVDDGDIAVVIIDDEATLKRVKYDRKNNVLVLLAENPKYDPIILVGEQLDHVHILGKAIFFQVFLIKR